MNGLDTIIQRLEAEASAEVAAIMAAAEQEAAVITADFDAQAQRLQAQLDAENQEVTQQRKERLESAAQMEGRKALLAAKQEWVAKVFAQAEVALCNLPQEQYIDFMARSLAKAAPKGTGSVRFGAKDQGDVANAIVSRANQAVDGSLSVSAEVHTMAGGFLLVDGQLEVNATMETLVRLQRSQYASQVAKLLFDPA